MNNILYFWSLNENTSLVKWKTSIHASTTEAFLPNTQQLKMGAYLPRGNLQISNWRLTWPFDDSFIGFPI